MIFLTRRRAALRALELALADGSPHNAAEAVRRAAIYLRFIENSLSSEVVALVRDRPKKTA